MENMMIFFLLSFTLSSILIILNSFISKKKKAEREKPSPFECGFDPKMSSRLPFSLQFYLIAVIFLIFDVEITLIMPIPILMKTSNLTLWMYIMMLFIMILLMGLYHEWNQGALQWKF